MLECVQFSSSNKIHHWSGVTYTTGKHFGSGLLLDIKLTALTILKADILQCVEPVPDKIIFCKQPSVNNFNTQLMVQLRVYRVID